jgi:hypothetical protein
MIYFCEKCNYYTNIKCNFDKHNKSKKHCKKNEEINDKYVCKYCNTKIKHQSNYSRHTKKCKEKIEIEKDTIEIEKDIDNNEIEKKLELEKLKHKLEIKDLQHKLELELKDKSELELKHKLEIEIKDLKIKHLKDNKVKSINITNNIDNSNNTINNISKLDNLNINYGSVIDIDTFIKNYEKEIYGLSEKDAEALLFVSKNGTIENIITSFMGYIKNSMRKQCENNNIILVNDKVILPFVLGDHSLRYHYEKKNDKEWCKTEGTENIENLISITEKQVYEHKKEAVYINGTKKRRIVNGMLKKSTVN